MASFAAVFSPAALLSTIMIFLLSHPGASAGVRSPGTPHPHSCVSPFPFKVESFLLV